MVESGSAGGCVKVGEATFGAGCFWCVEAVFSELDGVLSVQPGYVGGSTDNPTYESVGAGSTGHAEACRIRYDPARIRYEDLLAVFFSAHDPTTRDRQGHDVGSQYRSAVFFHDAKQKATATQARQALDATGAYPAPIVTEIVPIGRFFAAEAYHQEYFKKNPSQAYCRFVIAPKVDRIRQLFWQKLKADPAKGPACSLPAGARPVAP